MAWWPAQIISQTAKVLLMLSRSRAAWRVRVNTWAQGVLRYLGRNGEPRPPSWPPRSLARSLQKCRLPRVVYRGARLGCLVLSTCALDGTVASDAFRTAPARVGPCWSRNAPVVVPSEGSSNADRRDGGLLQGLAMPGARPGTAADGNVPWLVTGPF